jgi:hypothetical protein
MLRQRKTMTGMMLNECVGRILLEEKKRRRRGMKRVEYMFAGVICKTCHLPKVNNQIKGK